MLPNPGGHHRGKRLYGFAFCYSFFAALMCRSISCPTFCRWLLSGVLVRYSCMVYLPPMTTSPIVVQLYRHYGVLGYFKRITLRTAIRATELFLCMHQLRSQWLPALWNTSLLFFIPIFVAILGAGYVSRPLIWGIAAFLSSLLLFMAPFVVDEGRCGHLPR